MKAMADRLALSVAAVAAAIGALGIMPAQAASSPVPPQPPHLPGAPVCGPSLAPADQPTTASSPPPPAPRYFADDFPAITDSRLHVPIGGFGGVRRGAPLHHTPVIFVHGNQADAQNWLSVMLQFQNNAHYSMQEMYALSYNGLGNAGSGTPVTSPPTAPDKHYFDQNPEALANGGHGAADDDEVPDLCRFIEAVQWYTGSRQVNIVTHSLGVTIARQTMRLYPSLAAYVTAFVGIAGGNHGTTACRGLESTWYGCNEIAPGTTWLARLNGPNGSRETYPPTTWMTIYNGSGGDPLFVGPDETSPRLHGADNRTFPGAYHNDLRVGPPEVDSYLAFLLAHGQAGPGAAPDSTATAQRISSREPDGRDGDLCGVPKLTGPVPACSASTSAQRPAAQRATSQPTDAAAAGSSAAGTRELAATGPSSSLPAAALASALGGLLLIRAGRRRA